MSIAFGVWHSDFLEVGTQIDMHSNGLLGEGKIEHFYLDVGRIIGNFHFFHCSTWNFGGYCLQLWKGQISFFVG